jgi:hypothetical protein
MMKDDAPGKSPTISGGIKDPSYRRIVLQSNNIHIRYVEKLPNHVDQLDSNIRKERASPPLPEDDMHEMMELLADFSHGCAEGEVVDFFKHAAFPTARLGGNARILRNIAVSANRLISGRLLPHSPECGHLVSQPTPDILYGYSGDERRGTFTPDQMMAQEKLFVKNLNPDATTVGIRLPFLAVEIKAAEGDGSIWTATNQCADSMAACLAVIGLLNGSLPESESAHKVQNIAYGSAMDNKYVELFVAWKEDDPLGFYLQRIDTLVPSRPAELEKLRSQARSILEWGKGRRLGEVRAALDAFEGGVRQ